MSAVTALIKKEFWNHIKALSNIGVSVLVTTHFMDEAKFCDNISLFYNGEIIALDTPENIFSNLPLLKKAGLSLPQSSELLLRLKENGVNINTKAVSIDKTVDILSNLLKGGKPL